MLPSARSAFLAAPLLLLALATTPATAELGSYGVRGGISLTPDQFFIGAHMRAYEFTPEVAVRPNVEVGFGDDLTLIGFGAAVDYAFKQANWNGYTPYAGGELGIMRWSWDNNGLGDGSDSGLALSGLGGVRKAIASGRDLCFELKVGLSDHAPDFKIFAGIDF